MTSAIRVSSPTPKPRTCKVVQLMFLPDEGGLLSTPSLGDECPSLGVMCPDAENFDKSTPGGIEEYVNAVSRYANKVEAFEARVENFSTSVEAFEGEIEEAFENADQPDLFVTFTNSDIHREIEIAGFLRGDECALLLLSDYRRLESIRDMATKIAEWPCVACADGVRHMCQKHALERVLGGSALILGEVSYPCGCESDRRGGGGHVCVFDETPQATIGGGYVRMCMDRNCGSEEKV